MVRVGAEAKILLKIAKLVESIRSKLLDAGFNHKEVSSFFSIRIFKGKASSESAIDGHQTLNDQLMGVITRAKENKSSLEKILLDILEKLQIENGFIEEYENYEPESLPPVKVDKRKSSEDSVEEAPQRQRNFLSSW